MLALQAGLPSTATTNGEMRDLLLSSLTSALRERAAFPSESSLEGWDANELEEYCGFRDAHLQEAFAEIARHEPSVPLHIAIELYQEGSNAKTTPAGAPPPPPPASWQSKEAALFGMISTSEVLLSRILPLPSSSSSYQTPPPPPLECSPLESALITLLQLVLHTSPTALGGGGSSYSDTLLLRGRCQLVGALAPWLAGSGQPHLDAAVAGVLPCLTHAAAPTASAALICWNQLSMRCASELAASQERLMAALNLIATPTPALSEEQRQQLVESTTRFAIASPEGDGQRTRLLEGLLGPLMQSMTQPLAELERSAGSGGGGAQDAAVVSLRVRLNDLAAALRPLRAVGKDAYASLLTHVWPVWCRAAAVAPIAPSALIPPLCAAGRAGITGAGTASSPLLQPTINALTTTLSAAPSEASCLFDVANAIFEVFSYTETDSGMEASFGSLLDLFSGIVLPLVEKAEELHYVQKAGASSCAPAVASSTPPLSYDPDELRGELLSHAGRLGAMMPPALAAASSLPALVTLATTALTSSRREGPHGVDPAIELLTALPSGACISSNGPASRSRAERS